MFARYDSFPDFAHFIDPPTIQPDTHILLIAKCGMTSGRDMLTI